MSYFGNPFLSKLKDSKVVLLAGCGGGFDFLSGLPLYEFLRKQGKQVIYANLSFMRDFQLNKKTCKEITKHCFEITADTEYKKDSKEKYMPEKYLCVYYKKKFKIDLKMYIFAKAFAHPFYFKNEINVQELENCYDKLVEMYNIDTAIICDGGNDSLMKGNEKDVGTVVEDMTSIAALFRCKKIKQERKFMTSLGFGIDKYHGCHSTHVLENISSLISISKEGYLGCFSLIKEMKEYQVYKEATEFICEEMDFVSIVGSSIISSVDGRFGDYHATKRTRGSKLFINPLMSIYWCFQIKDLVKQIHFIQDVIKKDAKCFDIGKEFEKYRKTVKKPRPITQYPH